MIDFPLVASCCIILVTIGLLLYLQKGNKKKNPKISKPRSKEELLQARVKHFQNNRGDVGRNTSTDKAENHLNTNETKLKTESENTANIVAEPTVNDEIKTKTLPEDEQVITLSLSCQFDGNVSPECKPIKTLPELLNWRPGFDELATGRVLRRPVVRDSSRPKTLICHDMKGGYIEDRFIQGYNSDQCFTFNYWNYIDSFCYFSHNFITIPPPCWTNAAHTNGVKMLGTFITEWKDGAAICSEIFQSIENVEKVVERLVEISKYYQFDGWLINIENPIAQENVENIRHFLLTLTESMHKVVPDSEVIWYDSVTRHGELKWQNKLCIENVMFFDACDGIFLNYNWSMGDLQHSLVMSRPNRQYDVYVGVDVFGRGCYGGGGWNSCKAMNVIREQNLSAAIFAPGWVMETQGEDNFPENEEKFWKLLRTYIYGHSVSTLPLISSYCKGYGKKVFICGQEVSSSPWTNLSSVSIQPTYNNFYQLGPYNGMEIYLKSSGFTTDSGFNGGGSYEINGVVKPHVEQTKTVFRLFDTKIQLKAKKEYFFSHSYYTSTDKVQVFAMLLFEERPNYLLFMSESNDGIKYTIPPTQEGNYLEIYPTTDLESCFADISLANGWKTLNYKFSLPKHSLLKEVRVACTTGGFEEEHESTEFTVKLGEIRLHHASDLLPNLPTSDDIRCQNVNIQNIGDRKSISFTLSWDYLLKKAVDLPKCFDIFCKGCNGQEFSFVSGSKSLLTKSGEEDYGVFIGRAFTDFYYVSGLIVPSKCTGGIKIVIQGVSYADVRQNLSSVGAATLRW